MYLAETLDKHIRVHLNPRVLKRYIDDGVCIIKLTPFRTVHDTLNSWHKSLHVAEKDLTLSRHKVHILDTWIIADEQGFLHHETYRKPLTIYDYIPAGSAHKKTMFASIARSECMRMTLTNTHRKDFLKNMRLFANKARNRGHCVRQIIQNTKHIEHANRFNMLQTWRQERAQQKPL